MLIEVGIVLLKIVMVLVPVLLTVAYLTYLERKIIGRMQVRLGPTRVGPFGLLQPIADGLKLFFKEDIVPTRADKFVFIIAPLIVLIPSLILFSAIPFSEHFYITNLNIGVLYILSIASLGVYGVVLSGWASNSKYSMLGGLRSAAQMVSYEVFLGFALIGPIMMAGTLNLVDFVNNQKVWYIICQPVAFFMFMVSALAETNRVPFDLPEAETELVSGFHTEYSGMKFALFFLAEYANMIVVCSLATIVFLGGWKGPFIDGAHWFLLKTFLLLFVFIWLRATLPRYRYDQLMAVGWKVMFPVAIANIFITGIIIYW